MAVGRGSVKLQFGDVRGTLWEDRAGNRKRSVLVS